MANGAFFGRALCSLADFEGIPMRYAVYIMLIMPCALLLGLLAATAAQAREWRDSTGKYAVEADLIASTDDQVVLKREDGKLVMVEATQLSDADREYLESKEADAAREGDDGKLQTWTMRDGMQVVGRLVGYGRKEVVMQRRRGDLYVNDRKFENLPEIYQRMVPRIVSHFEEIELKNEKDLKQWAIKQNGEPRTFISDGVMLELENGDEYAVPFIFFSDENLEMLKPGWERWLANHEEEARMQRENLMLEAKAEAYQRDRVANQQIVEMQLLLSAVDAGVTDLWEVYLEPGAAAAGPARFVVVPGRNSRQAVAAALNKNPGYVAGPVRKLN
jgi:hypothetical protein